MLIIPAIDLIDGHCVRLYKGDYGRVTSYGDDLTAITRRWVDAGASRIHLVDLDGAKSGKPINQEVITSLVAAFPDTEFEVGGGIRTIDQVRNYLESGVTCVILGSIAWQRPDYAQEIIHTFANRILLGMDTHNGSVKISGWLDDTGSSMAQTLAPFTASPLAGIIHTDIARDGTLKGANLAASARLAQHTDLAVFASGGVSGMRDIEALCRYRGTLAGVIVGKSLYEGTIDLAQAISMCQQDD